MYRSTRMLAFFCLAGVSLNAGAVEIDVGNRRVNVPLPDGYVELAPEMSPYYETMKAYIAPTNIRYLTLITTSDAEAILRGEVGDLKRYMNIESEKGVIATSVSSATYDELRRVLRTQLDDLVAKANEQMPGIIEKGNAAVSEAFDTNIAVDLGGMVPLPIHLDSANTLAYSMYLTVGVSTNGEKISNGVIAATVLALHVKDKVLFLYIYGPDTDIDWTREFASIWAAEIVAANPLSVEEKLAVEQPRSRQTNWDKVLKKAAVGALIGGVAGILGFLLRRRKKE